MSEYQKPYRILWRAIDKAVAELKEQNYGLARMLLTKAQVEAEEAFLSWTDDAETPTMEMVANNENYVN